MEIFQEIKREVTDSTKDLPDTLRKAKILASSLGNIEFKNWVNRELRGYKEVDNSDIPDYRKIPSQNYGNFSDYFGTQYLKNQTVPLSPLPDFIKDYAKQIVLRESIGELNSMSNDENEMLQKRWPAEYVGYVQQNDIPMYENMHLVAAWQLLSTSQVKGIVDTIRTRLLDFILELEESFPDLVKSEESLKKIPSEVVENYYQVHISGDKNVVATGKEITQNVKIDVKENDLDSLLEYLESIGVPPNEVDELEEIVKTEDAPKSKNKLGEKLSNWYGRITQKVVSGVITVATEKGTGAILEAISIYYGLAN